MKAGTSANDHGPFRAAASVQPVDMRGSEWLTVSADDLAVCEPPWPEMTHDIVYRTTTTSAGELLDLRTDVFAPLAPGPHPVVVFVPGGGFVMSPKSGALLRRTAIAERGVVVMSIEYRTLRHGTYGDGVIDVAAAVDWARVQAPAFGGDPDRVAIWGESAGGYLASLALTTGLVGGVRCAVSTFGLTDLSQVAMDFDADERARHLTSEITEAQYVFGRGSGMTIVDDPAEVERANPVARVNGREPPFLLLHGEVDGLVSPGQSQLLHQALLAAGVTSRRVVVRGAGHYGLEWSSRTVLDLIGDFLLGHLAPIGSGP
jgi:acetyl esterase/lipase